MRLFGGSVRSELAFVSFRLRVCGRGVSSLVLSRARAVAVSPALLWHH